MKSGNIIRLLPKVELHRHLIGSVRIETLVEIAIENDVPLPTTDVEKLKDFIQNKKIMSSLRQFLKPLNIIGLCFCDKETIERITYEVVEDAVKDNIKYLELIIGPAFEASFYHLSLEEVFEGVINGVKKAEEKYEIKVNLIVGPTFKWKKRNICSPLEVLEASLKYREKVVGFGIPAETKEGLPFSKWGNKLREKYIRLANRAKQAGLAITAHAGEVSNAQSVIDAINYLGASRIGHGIKIIENPSILDNVVNAGIPFEICVSSNIKSGVVKRPKEHPVRQLWESGVKITINTDDPTLCNTTLTKELSILSKNFSFSLNEIKQLIFNASASSFLVEKERNRLYKMMRKCFAKLEY